MDRLVEENFPENEAPEREMLLAADVKAEDEAYTISSMVPGLEADDVSVEILNNTVSVRGEFKNAEREEGQFLMSELPVGRFSRIITLPTALDPLKAEASLKNGVFTLRIPKAEAARPKVIKITAG
jgi:HSP20 family protein